MCELCYVCYVFDCVVYVEYCGLVNVECVDFGYVYYYYVEG